MSEMRKTNPEGVRNKEILTPEEMGALLGIGRTLSYKVLADNTIPSFKIGKLRRVRRADVEAFIEEQMTGMR